MLHKQSLKEIRVLTHTEKYVGNSIVSTVFHRFLYAFFFFLPTTTSCLPWVPEGFLACEQALFGSNARVAKPRVTASEASAGETKDN